MLLKTTMLMSSVMMMTMKMMMMTTTDMIKGDDDPPKPGLPSRTAGFHGSKHKLESVLATDHIINLSKICKKEHENEKKDV